MLTHIVNFFFVPFLSYDTVATTNAIAAGLQIMQALQILNAQKRLGKKTGILLEQQEEGSSSTRICSYLNILRNPTRNGLYITAGALARPNPDCFVCRNALVSLAIDVNRWKLNDFLQRIVKQELGFSEPTLLLEGGNLIWEEGEDADADAFAKNLQKTLADLPSGGIVNGRVLRVEDFSQDLTIDIAVTQKATWDDKNNEQGQPVDELEQFDLGRTSNNHHSDKKPAATPTTTEDNDNVIVTAASAAAKPTAAAAPAAAAPKEDEDDDDVCMIVDGPTDGGGTDEKTNGKRHAKSNSNDKDNGNSGQAAKKQKLSSDDAVEVIEIE
jgi:Ubiquitin/SUMO-activating enzyme ubiquitin-like domain